MLIDKNMNDVLKTALQLTPKPRIKYFQINTGVKLRDIAEPMSPLKEALTEACVQLNETYELLLHKHDLSEIATAYRKKISVRDNAAKHVSHNFWYKFDFSNFYDTLRIENVAYVTGDTDPNLIKLWKDTMIDPRTKGLIQGSPTSGVLAGIALIPFWINLRSLLQQNPPCDDPNAEITFTQYSDDLCISSNVPLDLHRLFSLIITALKSPCPTFEQLGHKHRRLLCKINNEKTRAQSDQYRRITGVSCNHDNLLTIRRDAYRDLRTKVHHIATGKPIDTKAETLLGQIGFMLYIDQTGKVERLLNKYPMVLTILRLEAIS